MNESRPRIEVIFKETFRQSLHCAVALFIIPLRWLGFWYALGFAAVSFFWNLLAMPRLFADTLRPREKAKGRSPGMLVYSGSILLMAALFPLPVLAAGWAVLSLADGLATLAGKLFGKKSLAWNPDKTWVGSTTFFVSGSVFGWLALIWTGGNLAGSSPLWTQVLSISRASWSDPGQLLIYSVCAGLVSALVESLPLKKIDDNLAAPLAYALVLTAMLLLEH